MVLGCSVPLHQAQQPNISAAAARFANIKDPDSLQEQVLEKKRAAAGAGEVPGLPPMQGLARCQLRDVHHASNHSKQVSSVLQAEAQHDSGTGMGGPEAKRAEQ